MAQTIQRALDCDNDYSYCTQRRLAQLEFENKNLRELLSIASEASIGSSLLLNSTETTSKLQDTTQSSPKSPSSPLSPSDDHRRQVFNTLFGNSEPQFNSKSPFINDNNHMPVIATPAVSPSVSLTPHTPSTDNITTSFTADIILPESNDLVRSVDMEDEEMTGSFNSGTSTPLAAAGDGDIVSNSSTNNKMLCRRTAEEYMSNR